MKFQTMLFTTLAAGCCAVVIGGCSLLISAASARTNSKTQYCSAQAERHADRKTRRRTATGAVAGAAVGSVVRPGNGNAGRGALIGGSAGLIRGNSQWRTYYNREYRACMSGGV